MMTVALGMHRLGGRRDVELLALLNVGESEKQGRFDNAVYGTVLLAGE